MGGPPCCRREKRHLRCIGDLSVSDNYCIIAIVGTGLMAARTSSRLADRTSARATVASAWSKRRRRHPTGGTRTLPRQPTNSRCNHEPRRVRETHGRSTHEAIATPSPRPKSPRWGLGSDTPRDPGERTGRQLVNVTHGRWLGHGSASDPTKVGTRHEMPESPARTSLPAGFSLSADQPPWRLPDRLH